jgi:hypothetical protein
MPIWHDSRFCLGNITTKSRISETGEIIEQTERLCNGMKIRETSSTMVAAGSPDSGEKPGLLLISADDTLVEFLRRIAPAGWRIEYRRDSSGTTEVLRQPYLRLVVLDDEAVAAEERGWLLAQVRRHRPGAALVYVASDHNGEVEKRARAGGANYYTSKPIHEEQLADVLISFMRFHR